VKLMAELSLPNPGYPQPQGVRIATRDGRNIRVGTRFLDVVMDAGVPTPRFAIVLPRGMDPDPASYQIETLTCRHWPPGTIICFDQVGNAQVNAERIVAQTLRDVGLRAGMTREENP
jgi:hypothetical protein